MALKFDIEVRVLRKGNLEHWRIEGVIEQLSGNVPAIQVMPDLLCFLPVCILDQGLKASALLEGRNLADEAEGRKDQVQRVYGDDNVRLHQTCAIVDRMGEGVFYGVCNVLRLN